MDFEKNVPEWQAKGAEPPSSLKENGFEAGYKPPAAYFNWFWNRVSACLTEIRSKLKGHAENTSNPHNVTASQLGLGNVNDTADADKSVKYASIAGTANKVQSSMTVRLNGGTTEGTDKLTFDGSADRSMNITPDGIGASKSDLSNVDDAVFRNKASSAGAVGLPVVAATSTDGISYTATVPGVTGLSNGLSLIIIPNKTSTTTQVTLNVNGFGAKGVRIPLSFNTSAMTVPKLETFFAEGRPVTVQFDSNYTSGGIWKTIDKQKTSAQDLYGTTPIESGGTGASDAASARNNLGITPGNIGAAAVNHSHDYLPLSGGNMTGAINFGGGTRGLVWTTANGTQFALRPYYGGNIFQITRKPSGGTEVNALSINSDGGVGIDVPLGIESGGTNANTQHQAQINMLSPQSIAEGTDILTLKPGIYIGVNNSTTADNYPADIWNPLVFVLGNQNSDTADDGYPTGAWNIIVTDFNGRIWTRRRQWNEWGDWQRGFYTNANNSMTGTLTISNNNSSAGHVKLWEDNEGGNIEISSPAGRKYQMDAYNETLRMYSYTDADGKQYEYSFNGYTGEFTVPTLKVTDTATTRSNLSVARYKKYDSGNMEFGAGNTSAWASFIGDDGTSYNQMDLGTDSTTFKKPITVGSGGTGATSQSGAFNNIVAPGGTMTGDIDFGNAANLGIQWTTDNGTRIRIRPYSPNNVFQITMKPSGGTEFGAIGIDTNGQMSLNKPLQVSSGGTGATTAAAALSNLGIIYSTSQPTYVEGSIWLKPVD